MEYGALGMWIGTIAGSVVGILGGVCGTYCSIRNSRVPRERAVVIRAAVECSVFVTLFLVLLLGGLFLLPVPYAWLTHLLWLPYALLLVLGIRRWNTVQARIRQQESAGGLAEG